MFKRTIEYHLRRSAHGSSLLRVVYAGALATFDCKTSWQFFEHAQFTDLHEEGTESGGVHLGAMAGTLDIVQRCYLGIRMHSEGVTCNPAVPANLTRLRMRIQYRMNELTFEVAEGRLHIRAAPTNAEAVRIIWQQQTVLLLPGVSHTFVLAPPQHG